MEYNKGVLRFITDDDVSIDEDLTEIITNFECSEILTED